MSEKNKSLNIPEYRAKRIDSDEYIVGQIQRGLIAMSILLVR